MTTPARRHFERVTAAEASAAADPGAPINASAYELMLIKLSEDRRRLKDIKSIERKIVVKRELLPEYDSWIEGVLEAGRGGQDAVLMTLMVWCVDVGDYARALRIGRYALQHDLAMPDQYQRDTATLITEEIADAALRALQAGQSADIDAVQACAALTLGHDMPDQVRAKLYKAQGLQTLRGVEGDAPAASQAAAEALAYLRRALELNDRAGVKKEIERCERHLKNHPFNAVAPAAPDASQAADGAPAAAT